MAATIQQASTQEILQELARRIPEPKPSIVADFIRDHCDLDPEAKMTFAEFAVKAQHLGLSKIKLSQSLAYVRGVRVFAGNANVRYVQGIKWK